MYRDDPLDDELELRAIVGDDAVDTMIAEAGDHANVAIETALDVLRLLQGWADEASVARWFLDAQRRLGDRSPIDLLGAGHVDEVHDAAKAWVSARS